MFSKIIEDFFPEDHGEKINLMNSRQFLASGAAAAAGAALASAPGAVPSAAAVVASTATD